jgi:hypothetical protein
LLLGFVACKAPGHAKEGDTLLAQASQTIDDLDGPTVYMPDAEKNKTLPDAKVVRLAIARAVYWADVDAMLHRLEKAGKRVSILVGKRRKVRGFQLSDELQGKSVKLTVQTHGKFCMWPPKDDEPDPSVALGKPKETELKCVQRGDKKHISRAYVRELVREANKKWGVSDVIVELHPHVDWADAVRAIDGARTCCKKPKREIRVKVKRSVPAG